MAMRADRKNCVMSVEFAMQRELEYRQKLENRGSIQSQVLRPSSSQDPRTNPRLMTSSYLHPIPGFENPGSALPARPPPYPNPAQQSRPGSSSAGPSRPSDHQRKKGPGALPKGIFTCKVCQIDCTTGYNLLTHYQGQKHRARLRGAKGKEVDIGGTPPKPSDRRPYCDLCGIWCADEHTYRLHFSCPNHILRQSKGVMSVELAMQREMAYRQRLESLQLTVSGSESGRPPAPPNQTSLAASRPPPQTGLSQSRNMSPKLPEHTSLIPRPRPKTIPSPRPRPSPCPPPPRGIFLSQTGPRTKPTIAAPRAPSPYVPQSPTGSAPRTLRPYVPQRPTGSAPRTPYVPQRPTGSAPRPTASPGGPSTRPSLLATPPMSQSLGPTLDSVIHKRKEAPTQQTQPNDHDNKMRKLSCELCEVECSSAANLKMHFMGHKHKAQVRKSNQIVDSSSLYCSLCEIWCPDQFSLKQHVDGKNHIRKLQSARNKRR